MRASDLDFSRIKHFSESEFPSIDTVGGERSVLEFTDARVIQEIDRFRNRLGAGVSPSPLAAGWVREGGSTGSRHYIGPIKLYENGEPHSARLSTAGDIFPYCDIREALLVALGMPVFGGVGVYLDTRGLKGTPQPMMHLDLRDGPRQVWMRYEGEYIYPGRGQNEMDFFFRKLAEV